MKKLIVIGSALLALIIGCGSQVVEFPTDDDSVVTPPVDSGLPANDAGSNGDVGVTPPADSGTVTPPDASTPSDAGTPADSGSCNHDKCHTKCKNGKDACYGTCHNSCESDRASCKTKCGHHNYCQSDLKKCDDNCDCDFDSCDKARSKEHSTCDCTYDQCMTDCNSDVCEDCSGK